MKIILLEDEHLLNNNIKEYLELKGLNVEAYFDGAELLKNSNFEANLAILDIEVPGASGLEVIEWIKRVDENLPVIFITAYTDIKSIEKAYKLGCSDYLKKPFDLKELYLRVQQLLDNNNYKKVRLSKNIVFDMEHEQLYIDDDIIKLTKIQRKILKTFIKYKNQIVSYELLRSEVWEDDFVKTNTIASHVKEIRKHINSSIIESIRAEGYKIKLS